MADKAEVKLRWFGPEFESGDLDQDSVISDYRSHVEQLHAKSSDSIRELLDANLHDAQVRNWVMDGSTFTWSLVIGDLQKGYERVTIEYQEATLRAVTTTELMDFDLCDPGHELVSDEIDIAAKEQARLEQRFVFWPGFTFAIEFSDVAIAREPLSSRQA